MDSPTMAPEMSPAMALALAANFGSVLRWRDAFVALARAHDGRSGSVQLSFRPQQGTLVNQWAPRQEIASTGNVQVLVLDLNEHRSVDAFMITVDWDAAYRRYQHAVHDASEAAGADADAIAGALLLDVRRAGVFDQAGAMLPGARWRDPSLVSQWGAELPADQEIVVYCVYGHEVGRSTAMRLRAIGRKARYPRGGIDGWQAAGRPLAAKGAAS